MPSIAQALSLGRGRLKTRGIDTPGLDASLLLSEVTGLEKEKLYLAESEPLEDDQYRRFSQLLDRRLSGECIARILGRREFWGLDFMITPHVLVPRPDTEILVEAALDFLDRNGKTPGKVLDLCTGSGAVAIAVKHQRPGLEVYGSDISGPALETARANAETLLPKGQEPAFFPGDLFSALDPKASWRAFSVITANPPYVASGDIAGLAPEVRQEPRAALDGGEDGLNIIRRIVKEAPDYLVPGGGLFLEADPRQMPAIAAMLQNRGYGDISVRKDLAGLDRVISACFAADRGAP